MQMIQGIVCVCLEETGRGRSPLCQDPYIARRRPAALAQHRRWTFKFRIYVE